MTPRARRWTWVLGLGAAAGLTAYGVLRAFDENLVFFYTPTQVAKAEVPAGVGAFRLGGLVESGSLVRTPGSMDIRFRVTDRQHTVVVRYRGVVPALFQEGKGVVAQGRLEQGVFLATEILAKHDENYRPPDLRP